MSCSLKPARPHHHAILTRALDALNVWLADGRGALGPYLNVFLITQRHWSQSSAGLVTTISGLLGLIFQTPVGALIDNTSAKRGLVVAALAVLAAGAIIITAWPQFWPVLVANTMIALVGDFLVKRQLRLHLGCSSVRNSPGGWHANRPPTSPATLQSRF